MKRIAVGLLVAGLFVHQTAARARSSSPDVLPSIPFRLFRDYLIVVQGSLDDRAGFNLVIDTGSYPSILDVSAARALGLKGIPSKIALVNGSVPEEAVLLPAITIGPIKAQAVPVMTGDLSFLTKDLGVHVDAIVGLDVLASSFSIDYWSRMITFGPSPSLGRSVPFESSPPLVTVTMQIEGEPMRLLVDTGASGLLLFLDKRRRFSQFATSPVSEASNLAGKFYPERIELSEAQLGKLRLLRQRAYVVRPQKDVMGAYQGLMGIPAVGIHEVAFDFERGTLSWR